MFCNKSLCCIVHILVTRTTDYQGGNIRGINWVFFTHPYIDANLNPLGNAKVYYSKLYQYQYLHGQYTWLVRQDLNNCKKVNWKKNQISHGITTSHVFLLLSVALIIAYSSTDVDVLKFQLVQYNQFYDGKNQQDSSECLLMLIEIINKGSVPYYGSHVSNSTGVSLSDILFSFMLEKYIVCNVCGLRSPSIESSGVLYISPTHTSSMQELIMQGLQQKLEKSCFRCNKNTWHVESNHILQPPNYLIIVVNRFRYIINQFAKDKCSIPMDMTVVLGYHKFSLQATIDHHGPSIYSGHYTTSVNCCNRTFYCNDNKITEFDMINTKNSSTAYVVIYKLIT